MKSLVSQYEMAAAKNLSEVFDHLDLGAKIFAGGTDLMVVLDAGKLLHKKFISIHLLKDLKQIHFDKNFVTIGSLVTYGQLRSIDVIQKEFPMLVAAAKLTGAIAIQNRGTIGGNIVNASPAADTPPALLAYGAEIELSSREGQRYVPYDQFHLDYKKMILKPHEIVTSIRIPRNTAGCFHYYHKVGTRQYQSISKVCFAGVIKIHAGKIDYFRLGMGAVAPTPYLCQKVALAVIGQSIDEALIQKAQKALVSEIRPIDDLRSTKEYRKKVAENLLKYFLENAQDKKVGFQT